MGIARLCQLENAAVSRRVPMERRCLRSSDTSGPVFASFSAPLQGVPPYRRSVTTLAIPYEGDLQYLRPIHFGFTVARRHAMAIQKPRMAVAHKTVNIDGLDIFYREAGSGTIRHSGSFKTSFRRVRFSLR
jgi:hypothetical protein